MFGNATPFLFRDYIYHSSFCLLLLLLLVLLLLLLLLVVLLLLQLSTEAPRSMQTTQKFGKRGLTIDPFLNYSSELNNNSCCQEVSIKYDTSIKYENAVIACAFISESFTIIIIEVLQIEHHESKC